MIHEHPFVLMDVTPLNSPLKHMEQQIIDMTTPFRCNYITKDTKFTEKKSQFQGYDARCRQGWSHSRFDGPFDKESARRGHLF